MVEQRTFSIDEFPTTGDVSKFRSRLYTNKSPGTGLMAAIPYAVLYSAERLFGIDPNAFVATTFNAWVCTVLVCGLTGALIPVSLYRWARRARGLDRRWALAIALLVAFGTPLFAYSTALFAHVPGGSFLLLSFVTARLDGRPLLSGFLAGLAALTNYLCIPIVVLFALLQRRTRLLPYFLAPQDPADARVLSATYRRCCLADPTRPWTLRDDAGAVRKYSRSRPEAFLDHRSVPRSVLFAPTGLSLAGRLLVEVRGGARIEAFVVT